MAAMASSSSLWGTRLGACVAAPPRSSSSSSSSGAGLLVVARKQIEGKVVTDVRDKTVAVEVTRLVPDPKYKRRLRHTKRFHAHDPDNACKVGDWVTLASCRPISKTKHYVVASIRDPNQRRPGSKKASKAPSELPPLQSEAGAAAE